MKILRIDLIAFGIHRDRALVLEEPDTPGPGLHVIYGGNEAGKSTMLRALRSFFFEFPPATPDAAAHAKPRVGVTLRDDQGEVHRLVRQKKKNLLVRADDGEEVDEAILRRMLGGIDKELFNRLFGLTDDALREGGEALLTNAGRIDHALAGVTRLGEVLQRLEDDANALYSPRAGRVRQVAKELSAARQAARAAAIDPRVWAASDAAIEESRERRDEGAKELREVEGKLRRATTLRQTLSTLRERAELRLRLEALDGPTADEDAARNLDLDWLEARDALVNEIGTTEDRLRELDEQGERLTRELAEFSPGDEALAAEERIDGLIEERGGLLDRVGRLDEAEWRLGPDDEDADARDLLGDDTAVTRTLQTMRSLAEDAAEAAIAAQERDRMRGALDDAEAGRQRGLSELPDGVDGNRLAVLAERLRNHLLTRRDGETLDDGLASDERGLAARLADQGLWREDLEALARAELPSPVQLEALLTRDNEERRRAEGRRERRDEGQLRLDDVNRRLRVFDETDPTPDPEELDRTRTRRDAAWREIHQRWIEGADADARKNGDLAADFERDLHASDRIGDRLRAGASRHAERIGLAAERDKEQAFQDRLTSELEEIEKRRRDLVEEARQCWHDLPVKVVEIGPMATFLREVLEIRTRHRELCARREAADAKRRERDEALSRLDADLRTLGLEGLRDGDDLDARRAELELQSRSAKNESEARQRLLAERDRDGQTRRRLDADDAKAKAQEEERARAWRAALDGLSPALAEEVPDQPQIRTVEALENRRQAAEARRWVRGYRQRLREVVVLRAEDVLPRLDEGPTGPVLTTLQERWQAAREALATHRERQRKHREVSAERDRKAETLANLRARLGRHDRELRADDDETRAREVQALRERLELRQRLETLEDTLRTHVDDPEALDALAREAADVDREELETQTRELEARHRELGERQELLQQEVGRREREQQELTEREGAAAATAEIATDVAVLMQEARRYRVLKTAEEILRSEFETFRARSQGPVLERASRFMRDLSEGSIVAIETRWEGQDEDVLVARRASGEGLGVEALSSGTRDQLFLALKLATIEHLVVSGRRGSLPVVLDDVLVHFDDIRGRAAIDTLANAGEHLQIILLTHDRRIADHARSLGDARARVHELERLPSIVPGVADDGEKAEKAKASPTARDENSEAPGESTTPSGQDAVAD